MSILKLENVGYRYKDAPKDSYVFKNVNYEFGQGKMYAIKGKSGSGKTTLLSLITGLEKCTDGKVLYDGKDLKKMNLDTYRNTDIGIVFQSYNLVPVLNVYENVVLPVELDGDKVDTAYIKEVIGLLGLNKKLESLPSQLSGGQQQRVAIARALAAKPAILLADEPTGNLDSATSQDVLGLLRVTSERFHQTIVMITHNEEIAQMADRIIRIEDGKIVSGKQTMQMMDKNPEQKEGADCVEREK